MITFFLCPKKSKIIRSLVKGGKEKDRPKGQPLGDSASPSTGGAIITSTLAAASASASSAGGAASVISIPNWRSGPICTSDLRSNFDESHKTTLSVARRR